VRHDANIIFVPCVTEAFDHALPFDLATIAVDLGFEGLYRRRPIRLDLVLSEQTTSVVWEIPLRRRKDDRPVYSVREQTSRSFLGSVPCDRFQPAKHNIEASQYDFEYPLERDSSPLGLCVAVPQ